MLSFSHEFFSHFCILGSSLAPPRTTEPPQNIDAAFVVFNDMKKTNFFINESIYTAMIRCCSINSKIDSALQLYYDMQKENIIPKLRTISPLLTGFSIIGNSDICFKIFDELINLYDLIPGEREYSCMLKVTVICKDYRFYTVLHQFMEDVLVPTKTIWSVVTDWFLDCENER